MAITLRPHQLAAASDIESLWAQGFENVVSVLPTGAGKTILMAEMARRELLNGGLVVIFAHRDVLLGQISDALCLLNLPHSFITSNTTRREICDQHVENYGKTFKDDRARIVVCSVDTFYRRDLSTLAPMVTKWFMDETHHLLDSSKWHKCIDPLINAKGLGVTATPIRADKKGLGRCADGVFDAMTVGATMHELIQKGMLSPYRVYTPPSRVNISQVKVTASGDYNQKELAKATDRSEITGDAVSHYLKLAKGKQAIAFTVNIDHGAHVAEQFRKAGITAVNLSSKTKAKERNEKIAAFRRGEIKVLVNCDLFGEGFDVPSVECVIMLRKTQSYSLFKQQFGRGLRIIDGKEFGILIDHVGNVEHFMHEFALNYPHEDPPWSLDRPKKKRNNAQELDRVTSRVCPDCFARYVPSTHNKHQCPYCNHVETKEEELDALKKFQAKKGDLVEMNIDFINQLLSERAKVDRSPEEVKRYMANAPAVARHSAVANHTKRLNAQTVLRDKIQRWCIVRAGMLGLDVPSTQREFELKFGINILKAQVLSERETNELIEKMNNG